MDRHIKIASVLVNILDRQFKIFGFRFGLDPLIGFWPVVGDIVPAIVSLYLVWIAIKMELPQRKIIQMIANVILDLVLGIIPVLGDLVDFVYKANVKNLEILKNHKTKIIEGEIIE